MDAWFAYAPVKNNPEDAAKVPKGNPYPSATSGEMAIYKANNLILRKLSNRKSSARNRRSSMFKNRRTGFPVKRVSKDRETEADAQSRQLTRPSTRAMIRVSRRSVDALSTQLAEASMSTQPPSRRARTGSTDAEHQHASVDAPSTR
ncbi:UDP-sugar pyrophosphorylase [Phtheirospermum japonicum]|uniref:UDP-sugar pyrophosphorylase n=1 Tax=Phtheirospermum japonicum TaxID=374723 RepID=A0A830D2E6_9LAMI|nr:UDP-sugar pyrophosphorylase [Phtheirospermum japonicum]